MATIENDSYEMLQSTTKPGDEPNYMHVIRHSECLQVVDEPKQLQELSQINTVDEPTFFQAVEHPCYVQAVDKPDYLRAVVVVDPSHGRVTDKAGFLHVVQEPGYLGLQVIDGQEQGVATTFAMSVENVSCSVYKQSSTSYHEISEQSTYHEVTDESTYQEVVDQESTYRVVTTHVKRHVRYCSL